MVLTGSYHRPPCFKTNTSTVKNTAASGTPSMKINTSTTTSLRSNAFNFRRKFLSPIGHRPQSWSCWIMVPRRASPVAWRLPDPRNIHGAPLFVHSLSSGVTIFISVCVCGRRTGLASVECAAKTILQARREPFIAQRTPHPKVTPNRRNHPSCQSRHDPHVRRPTSAVKGYVYGPRNCVPHPR